MAETRLARFGDAVLRTRAATAMTLRRRDGRAVFAAVSVAYLLVYLWGIGHLAAGLGGFNVTVVDDPLSALIRSEGAFSFRPVARVALGPVTYLASLNTLVGGGVAALVGLNLAVSYLAWRQPAACGIGRSSSGLFAGIPALLSGTACCGPVVLIAVGIQASSALLTAFQLLLPAAVLMLLGSLLLVGRQITVA
jgi:hypothetical protein